MSSQMAESPSFSWQSNIPLQTHIWASQVVQLVKNLPSHAGDTGLTPGQGTKTQHAELHGQKEKRKSVELQGHL